MTNRNAAVKEPKRHGPSAAVNDDIAAWKANGWQDLSSRAADQYQYDSVWRAYNQGSIGS